MDFSLFSPPSRVSSTILSSTNYPVIQHPVIQSVAKDLGNIHVYILALCTRDSSSLHSSDEFMRACSNNDKKKALKGVSNYKRTFHFVIQSEAKNLKSASRCIQILPPFGRLDDRMFKLFHFDTPTSAKHSNLSICRDLWQL